MNRRITFTSIKEVAVASGSSGESVFLPRRARPLGPDADRCRVFKLWNQKQAQGLKPPWPRAPHTTLSKTQFSNQLALVLGTSVGLGIARTDSGWRDGAENTTLLKQTNKQRKKKKKTAEVPLGKKEEKLSLANFSTFKRKCLNLPNPKCASLTPSERYEYYSWTTTNLCLFSSRSPCQQTQEG